MNKSTYKLLTITFGSLLAAHCFAQQEAPTDQSAEITNKLPKYQEKYDLNQDGKLDDSEKAEMLKELDKNGDGKVNRDEVPKKEKAESAKETQDAAQ